MERFCRALVNLVLTAAAAVVFLKAVPWMILFFAPFAAGWMLAFLAGPVVRFFEEKLRIKRKTGSAVVIIAGIGLVCFLIYLIVGKLVAETMGFLHALPEIVEELRTDLAEVFDKVDRLYRKLPVDLQKRLADAEGEWSLCLAKGIGQITSPTISAVGSAAMIFPKFIVGLFMTLLSAYFWIADHDKICDWYRRKMPERVRQKCALVRRCLLRAAGGYLKAQLKIEVWIFLLLAAGLAALKIKYVLLISFGIACLDLLPVFGAGTVMLPWAVIRFLTGNYKTAAGLLIIWGLCQIVRQMIQPKIVGDSMGLAPLPTLFLLYAGYRLLGIGGMILSVPLGLTGYSLYQEGAFDSFLLSCRIVCEETEKFRTGKE